MPKVKFRNTIGNCLASQCPITASKLDGDHETAVAGAAAAVAAAVAVATAATAVAVAAAAAVAAATGAAGPPLKIL